MGHAKEPPEEMMDGVSGNGVIGRGGPGENPPRPVLTRLYRLILRFRSRRRMEGMYLGKSAERNGVCVQDSKVRGMYT